MWRLNFSHVPFLTSQVFFGTSNTRRTTARFDLQGQPAMHKVRHNPLSKAGTWSMIPLAPAWPGSGGAARLGTGVLPLLLGYQSKAGRKSLGVCNTPSPHVPRPVCFNNLYCFYCILYFISKHCPGRVAEKVVKPLHWHWMQKHIQSHWIKQFGVNLQHVGAENGERLYQFQTLNWKHMNWYALWQKQ